MLSSHQECPALGALNISFYLALYHRHSIITIQFSRIPIWNYFHGNQ